MKSRVRKHTDVIPSLVVVAFILLGVMCATRYAGFAHTEINQATPLTNPTVMPDSALHRAADYLWSRQAEDGGWHSEKYGLLRSGQALTPFVLHGLLLIPTEVHPGRADRVDRALAFIRRHTNEQGVLGVADPDVLEYPNYATAYALRCLQLVGAVQDRELIERMRAYLQAEQFTESRGIDSQSLAFGGWGFGGDQPFGETGHMDIAHTRRVLQALRESCVEDRQVYSRAERFLGIVQRHPTDRRPQPKSHAVAGLLTEPPASTAGLLQSMGTGSASHDSARRLSADEGAPANYDGGFYFSPVVLAANKGREARGAQGEVIGFRSYATSTCDGVLSLLACNVGIDDPRLRDATTWLAKHPNLDYPAGVPTDHPEPWGEAIHFYHLASRAEVYRCMNWPGDWRAEIEHVVVRDQRADGSFVNARSHLMKEDDPLLCTALALTALANATH